MGLIDLDQPFTTTPRRLAEAMHRAGVGLWHSWTHATDPTHELQAQRVAEELEPGAPMTASPDRAGLLREAMEPVIRRRFGDTKQADRLLDDLLDAALAAPVAVDELDAVMEVYTAMEVYRDEQAARGKPTRPGWWLKLVTVVADQRAARLPEPVPPEERT